MTYKHLKTIVLATLLLVSLGLHAQVSLNTAGGNAASAGGSISYTIGQMAFHAESGPDGSSTQGVQQPYEILVLSVSEESENISLSIYPNPSTDYLHLTSTEEISNLSYQLFDINGRLLKSERINGNQTDINMQSLVSATYFIKINQGNKTIKTYKIIKK